MQALGRRAAELLDPAGEEKADSSEPSFEARFEACGAAGILEDMEEQSNECARLLNRIRPMLAVEARNSLEDTLNHLLPLLTLQARAPLSQHADADLAANLSFLQSIGWSLRKV